MMPKQYRVAYELSITGEIDVMAEDAEDVDLALDEVDLKDLIEQRKDYEVYIISEPEEVK